MTMEGQRRFNSLRLKPSTLRKFFFWELKEKTPQRATEAIITWSEFVQSTGIGSIKLLEKAAEAASKFNKAFSAESLFEIGRIADLHSEAETAMAKYEEALQIFCRIGDSLGEANCIRSLGGVADSRSDYETATAKYEEALQIYRRIGEPLGEANCIASLGDVAQGRSDYETATAKYEEALQIYRRIGSQEGEANCFHGFGQISLFHSDYEQATERFNQALAIYRKIGSLRGEAGCLFNMGRLAFAQKDQTTARSHFEQALALFEKIDNPLWLSKTHRKLAKLADDETERTAHLELAHRFQERLATIDQMLLLEKEAKGED